jgi:serine/threonine-protein kinase HipA
MTRKANIYVDGKLAGLLIEYDKKHYVFEYALDYQNGPVSLTMPLTQKKYEYTQFPSFFEGLLPEGVMLTMLLKHSKLDSNDYFGQLIQVGEDLVGNVTVKVCKS